MPLQPGFSRPIADIAADFLAAKTVDDVCRCLEVPKGNLIYIAYKNGGVSRYYKVFEINKKSGGKRLIKAPFGGLKILQEKIQSILKYFDKRPQWSHGFHCKRSIVTNAKSHLKSAYILNVDIEEFYTNVHFGRVSGIFKNYFKFEKTSADLLAHICCYQGSLPQGSPCSPSLANLAAWSLDQKMLRIAKGNKLKYSRYADDITFSAKLKRFPASVGHYLDQSINSGPASAGPTLISEVSDAGFKLNERKSRLQYRRYHQAVTGLTVNEFANLPRHKIKEIRKLLFLWKKFGVATAAQFRISSTATENDFRNLVFGNLAFLKSVRGSQDAIFKKFCYDVVCITGKYPEWVKTGAEGFQVKDIFLSHASEDKDKIAFPLYEACLNAGVSVFYDADSIQWGDSIIDKINKGLGEAKIFVPIITPIFLQKKWPTKELNAAFSRFINDKGRILPILDGVGDLSEYPLMNDILYKEWNTKASFADEVALTLKDRLAAL